MHVGRGILYNQIYYILYLCKLNYTEIHCIFYSFTYLVYMYVYHNIYQIKFDSRINTWQTFGIDLSL